MPTLTDTELLQNLNQIKSTGNNFFKEGNFEKAYESYQSAINLNLKSNPDEYEKLLENLNSERLKEHDKKIEKENDNGEDASGDCQKSGENQKDTGTSDFSSQKLSIKFQTLAILHQNCAACCQKLGKANESTIEHCEVSLNYNPVYVKNIRRLAELYFIEGTAEEIKVQSNPRNDQNSDDSADENDPNNPYQSKLSEMDSPKANYQNKCLEMYTCLEKLDKLSGKESSQMKFIKAEVERRQEEMKQQMFSQLKSLGNMCLKPFGLSTNNFNLNDNGEGGYSVSFNK